jgi:hypothetical protein
MRRMCMVTVLAGVMIALGASALWPCEPGMRPRPGYSCARHRWAYGATLDDAYDGGWDYPRCVPVCTYNAECYPWKSADGRYLLFASINLSGPPRPGHQGMWDIYISEWDSLDQCWGMPVNPGPAINTSGSERRPSCTAACDTIYFDRDGDLYTSVREGAQWAPACPLPSPVNSESWDAHPAISADGKRLYFSSAREGGHGSTDIWVAYRSGASWDSVANIGLPVNSPDEETRPFESSDRQRLYFSNEHGVPPRPGNSYGGASDVYVSVWNGSGWGSPVPVVAPINNDLRACTPFESADGNELWIGSEAWEGSKGDEDIWVARKGPPVPPSEADGYGHWMKTGELVEAIYVYDLEEGPQGTIYAATACATDTAPAGKVFKTGNGGLTWMPCGDLPGAMVVYSLVVHVDTVYAGTFPEGDVFKSIDGGDSWANTTDLPEVTAARSMTRLGNGDLLVGTSPHNINQRNRIFRTTDGGVSWIVTASLPNMNPCKVLCQTSTGAIFAGGWGINCFGVNIHRSLDNGATWDSLRVLTDVGKGAVDGFCEAGDGALYAACWIPSLSPDVGGGFVCKSTDGGTNWDSGPNIMRGDGVHAGRIYSVVEDLFGTIYAGMQPAPDSVVFASSDGGNSWYSTGGLDGAYECLCLLRASDGTIYAGTTPNGDVFKFVPTAAEDGPGPVAAPARLRLLGNYPNPFASTTAIAYDVPVRDYVSLKVYSIAGDLVRTLLDGGCDAGRHTALWDGTDDLGREVASGSYLCKLESGRSSQTKRVVLTAQ